MPYNPNTCSSDTFVFDPPLLNFSTSKSSVFIASEKPLISSTNTPTLSTQDNNNVLSRSLSTCLGFGHGLQNDPSSPCLADGSPVVSHGSDESNVESLIHQDILNFDNWLLETTSSTSPSATPTTTNLDAAYTTVNGTTTPVSTTLSSKDGTGFDQLLSPLYNDASSTSAFNSPWTPYLDTPDPSPSQTPLFGYSNSEDSMRLDQLLMPQLAVSSGSSHLADVSVATTQDASTDSRLQAEPSLLDFVLFDDIATALPVSGDSVSTFTDPALMTTTTTPSTEELALQLVAAAAANLASAQSSSICSPLSMDASLGEMTSLFQESPSPLAGVETTVNTKNDCFYDATLSSPLQMNSAAIASPSSSLDEFALTSLLALSHDFAEPLNLGSTTGIATATATATLPAIAPYHPAHPVPLSHKSASVSTGVTTMTTSTTQACLKRKSNEEHAARALPTSFGAAGAAHSFGNNNIISTSSATTENGADAARPFVCSICGRAFSRLFNLNTHKITHDRAKARQFSCTEPGCKKAFTRKNDLQRHQITIHGVTHRFDCRDCKRPFARRDTLQRHLEQSESCSKEQLNELDQM
ncbi:hypothetical protein BGW42_001809 [Actinomortierella wolfii]|nr:hypothetical protein BGW42_001809 [Actinomortierella wolfii]